MIGLGDHRLDEGIHVGGGHLVEFLIRVVSNDGVNCLLITCLENVVLVLLEHFLECDVSPGQSVILLGNLIKVLADDVQVLDQVLREVRLQVVVGIQGGLKVGVVTHVVHPIMSCSVFNSAYRSQR